MKKGVKTNGKKDVKKSVKKDVKKSVKKEVKKTVNGQRLTSAEHKPYTSRTPPSLQAVSNTRTFQSCRSAMSIRRPK